MSKTKRKGLVAINKRGRRIGSTHQRAKHAEQVLDRIKELKASGLGYRRIAAKLKQEGTPVPWTTVRDIVKGHIRAQKPVEWRKPGERRAPGEPHGPYYDFPEFQWPVCG
jgi:DNA invertase Pin-like site-specific DNA recombinase